jgi:hypothetical protein
MFIKLFSGLFIHVSGYVGLFVQVLFFRLVMLVSNEDLCVQRIPFCHLNWWLNSAKAYTYFRKKNITNFHHKKGIRVIFVCVISGKDYIEAEPITVFEGTDHLGAMA